MWPSTLRGDAHPAGSQVTLRGGAVVAWWNSPPARGSRGARVGGLGSVKSGRWNDSPCCPTLGGALSSQTSHSRQPNPY